MVEIQASISFYKCRNSLQAKIYLPRRYSLGRRITLIYKGLEYPASVSPSHSVGGGYKIYVPARVRREYQYYNSKPNRVLLELDGETLEILFIGWRCRVCGEPTMEDDRLCWSHRIDEEGKCKRCGRMVEDGRSLCSSCLERFM